MEVVIRVHGEDGQVYTIRDPQILKEVKEYTEKKVEAINWKQQPHHDDDEDVYILDI